MIVLFDLDNTLIDTQRIKREIFYGTALEYGLSLEEGKELYRSIRNVDGKVTLTPRVFASTLSEKIKNTAEEIENKMYSRLQEIGENICIDGSGDLLQCAEQFGIEKYIMTLGVHSWQEEKIAYSGLEKFFGKEKRILPALELSEKEAKQVALQNYFGKKIFDEVSILFNDKADETARLLTEYPKMRALIRWDKDDERFTYDDFEKNAKQFGERFIFSDSLFELKEKFEYLLKYEYGQE